ncbi:DNA-dependent ATPase mgs1 [Massospora cicadina]|nr:DNA-dependent ATPase mgs1 [Massospora cicadina]
MPLELSGRGTSVCPICDQGVFSEQINEHIDSGCKMGLKRWPIGWESPRKSKGVDSPKKAKAFNQPVTEVQKLSFFQRPKPTSMQSIPSDASLTEGNQVKVGVKPAVSSEASSKVPLAELVRPQTLEDFFGQGDLLGPGGLLSSLLKHGKVPSLLFWGPPGCGKTTLAKVIGRSCQPLVNFKGITSVTHGIDEVRKLIDQANHHRRLTGQPTVLFVDEIHRYSKAQQDHFLPAVEQGQITLLAATTENPSFRVNSALLSRCKVLVLEKLDPEAIYRILKRAQRVKLSAAPNLQISGAGTGCPGGADTPQDTLQGSQVVCDEGLRYIGRISDGDARHAINALELILDSLDKVEPLSVDQVKGILQRTHLHYDQNGEEHYNLISALHKSIRGSSVEGALYWLGRMLYGGEDPLYIGRRLIRMASEDVGWADSHALPLAVATLQSCQVVGMPECDVMLAHCAAYLARAPKSVQVYRALKRVRRAVQEEPLYPVPLHLRNAPTPLMKDLGYGDGYIYNPDYPSGHEAVLAQTYLPQALERDGVADDLRRLLGKGE